MVDMISTSTENSIAFEFPNLRHHNSKNKSFENGFYSSDRFHQPDVRVFYNLKKRIMHRVVMESSSWKIQVQPTLALVNLIQMKSVPTNTQISQMTDLYQLWHMHPPTVDYCIGVFKFSKTNWEQLVFQFCDLAYYGDPNAPRLHYGGNLFSTKDLKRIGHVVDLNEQLTDSYLNDDILNTITCDILQPFTSKALYLSTHYHDYIKNIVSYLPPSSSSDIPNFLKWGKRSGKEPAQLLKHPSSTAIIHLNGNHW